MKQIIDSNNSIVLWIMSVYTDNNCWNINHDFEEDWNNSSNIWLIIRHWNLRNVKLRIIQKTKGIFIHNRNVSKALTVIKSWFYTYRTWIIEAVWMDTSSLESDVDVCGLRHLGIITKYPRQETTWDFHVHKSLRTHFFYGNTFAWRPV